MLALILCALAFVLAEEAGRRALVAGLGAVLAVGYAYGIVRANVLQPASHFVFDAAVIGLYVASVQRLATGDGSTARLKQWIALLVLWPLLLLAIPMQDPWVQVVGLRGHVFFLPFLVIGARLRTEELYRLALWCAVLNVVAFAFAAGEFVIGIEPFYPVSAVTQIIYKSRDVADYTAWRIPATFTSAHAYAGTLVATLPLLLGALQLPKRRPSETVLLIAGLGAATLGVFMAAARQHAIVLLVLVAVGLPTLVTRFRPVARLAILVVGLLVGLAVAGDERLQRFTTLQDTEFVQSRVAGSVNSGFFELVTDYPLGNGLGGGGTSLPYFLQERLARPVAVENHYGYIVLEQGLIGLLLWVAFIAWILTRPRVPATHPWQLGARLARVLVVCSLVAALIGTGTFTSVPQSCLLLLFMGCLAAPPVLAVRQSRGRREPARQPVVGAASTPQHA